MYGDVEDAPLVISELHNNMNTEMHIEATCMAHQKDAKTGKHGDGIEQRLADEPAFRGQARIDHDA